MAKEAKEAAIVVPVIDLGKFPAGELEKLAAACTELGCFRISNHGMPAALLAEMKATVRSLFDKPDEVKLRNAVPNLVDACYRSLNFDSNVRFYESFSIYDASSPPDVHSFCSVLDATPHQRQIITDYFAKLHGIIIDIASKVAESLGLVGCSFKEWTSQARLMSYKFTSQEDVGCVAAPVHTDTSFVTVLQEDDFVGGLQITDADGNFVDIDPLPGTLFVNIGDIGKVWSNERLQTVKHRVVCKIPKMRISTALFLLAPKDGNIETEPAFIDADHPKLYQKFIYNDYRKERNKCGFRTGEVLRAFNANHEAST